MCIRDRYKPDAFVKFSDAQTIGKLQAEKMVSKLKLDKASKDNPKYIEVLLPYTAVEDVYKRQEYGLTTMPQRWKFFTST